MKKRAIFFAIIFLTGLGVLLYPFISNMIYQKNASQVIEDYDKQIESMSDEEKDAIKEAAKKYNEQLNNVVSTDDASSRTKYKDILGENQVIGYIVIPKVDVNLPIYNSSTDDVLSKGVGHMTQSSFPLGGPSTHSVLTGHRGLPNAVLFTNLDKMEIGDEFYLHIMDEILAYKVDQIKVVEPNDSGDLAIVEGQDYCTLVTCTPYSINSHRLLVRGTRVEYTQEGVKNQKNNQLQSGSFTERIIDVWPWLLLAFVIIGGVETVIFILIIKKKRKKKREEKEEEDEDDSWDIIG